MQIYLNAHDTIEGRRHQAQAGSTQGPRVMIVGPTDAGKSTLSRILANYAIRQGRAPTLVDLDIGQGSITVPGCIAAAALEAPLDLEEDSQVDAPLVFYYGHTSPSENASLYRHMVERLAAVLEARATLDADVAAAGMIINSMGWIEDLGYDLLIHSAHMLKVDVILVVGSDRLASQLSKEKFKSASSDGEVKEMKVDVVKLPKSGGVVTRSRELRTRARKARVEEYFYGPLKELAPVSQSARVEDLQIYKVGGGPKAPASALPIGATSVADPLKLTKVSNFTDLLCSLVAVSHAPSPDLLLSVNVAGFIYIQDVDPATGTMTYLAPRGGVLPGKYLLAGAFKTYLD
jgi:polyribonucleotide 5'-hydroxyl-kinase